MRDTVNKIRLDLDRQKIRTSVSVCKGDTLSRTLYITLIHNGIVFDIPDDTIATLIATKPDGKSVYNDCTIHENEIGYTITNQLIVMEGDVECQVNLTLSDGTVITSPVFIIRVYSKFFDDKILESTNDYSALQSYCIRAETAAKEVEGKVGNIVDTVKNVSNESQASKSIENSLAYIMLVMNEAGNNW